MSLSAQSPTVAFPKNYKLVLDNADVAVLRVHYGPHETVGMHDHSDFTTVYVYLNDGPAVKFTHELPRAYVLTRPPTHAGAFRVSPGMVERHSAENLGDTSSEYLRVELKKLPVHTLTNEFRGPAVKPPIEGGTSVVYDNPALRIERVLCMAASTCTLLPTSAPSVLTAITPTALLVGGKGQMLTLEAPVAWLPSDAGAGVRSMGPAPVQLLRIELLKP